ncbi:MAG: type IV secretion system DNA-binding domain-containing protein [Patescibacteria group bacterium]
MEQINLFGEVNFRGQTKKFGIKTDDRRRHVYVIGKTGMGKTTLLENMVVHDILAGNGVGIVDPHGEFAEKMLSFIPKERLKDVIYFNPADTSFPIAFNPIENIGAEHRHLVASGLMGVFKKIWPDVWSARMEYILNNTLLTLLEYPDSTLLGIMRVLSDKDYRKKLVDGLKDPVIKSFWVNEFARYAQKFETEATAAIQNKIGKLVANPLIRHILGQSRSALDFRKAMDDKKIMIFNLSKGRIGEDNSALIGSMIITKLQLAAMSRVDLSEENRNDFYLYVDEFQNFATDSFADILSEARKYRLCLTLAHQYIGQLVHEMNTKVRDAVFGNVGTMLVFRVGAEDAEFLEKEFEPDFMATDLVNLPKANLYLKLMIDGVSSRPFSARGIGPVQKPVESHVQEIIEYTRAAYATPLHIVEEKISNLWASSKEDETIIHHREEKPRTMTQRPAMTNVLGEHAPPRNFVGFTPQKAGFTPQKAGFTPQKVEPIRPRPINPPEEASTTPTMSLRDLKPREAPPAPSIERRPKPAINVDELKKALESSLKTKQVIKVEEEDYDEETLEKDR